MESSAARFLRRMEATYGTNEPKKKLGEITIVDAKGKIDDLRIINREIFRGVNYSRQ